LIYHETALKTRVFRAVSWYIKLLRPFCLVETPSKMHRTRP